MKSGEAQNKRSMSGEAKIHKSGGDRTIKSDEVVGGKGPDAHSFRMPKDAEVCDHSNVRGSIGKE